VVHRTEVHDSRSFIFFRFHIKSDVFHRLQKELDPEGKEITSAKQIIEMSQNGILFVRLLKLRVPQCVDEKHLMSLTAEERIRDCMDKAEAYLKAPKILNPHELASGHVDEKSLMVYATYFEAEHARNELKNSLGAHGNYSFADNVSWRR
jgi:hypothetical protein